MSLQEQKILNELQSLPPKEREIAIKILEDYVDNKGDLYRNLWKADYDEAPPTIQEFLDDEEYLGKMGVSIYDVWRRDLEYIFTPGRNIWEWLITGAIGVGKTTVSIIAILFQISQLCCMRNPQKYFGLIENFPIIFGFFNIYKYLATDVGYSYFESAMKLSPFFKRIALKNRNDKIVGFPKNIHMAVGAQAMHILGQSVYGGCLDEANFGKKKSQTSTERSQMQDLYSQTRDRIASRFLNASGTNPGFLVVVTSKKDQSDFMEQHIEKVQGSKGVYISDYALWEAKTNLQSSKKFYVFCGDERRDPRILKEDEVVDFMDTGHVVPIPDTEYFRDRFQYDLPDALRNLAGVSTHGARKFIFNRELFWQTINSATEREHPFTVQSAKIGLGYPTKLVDYVNRTAILKLVDKTNDIWIPKYYPKSKRWIHVDLAKNQDAAGMCMGCIKGISRVEKIDEEGHTYKAFLLEIWIDFLIQIVAAPNSQIDFEQIRDIIYFLKDNHFPIDYVTYDWWQSTDSIQLLIKSGIRAKEQSMDRTRVPYDVLRACLLEGRLDVYNYNIFNDEILNLNDLGKKIDHPVSKSKDVSDSCAGVVFGLMSQKKTEYASYMDITEEARAVPYEDRKSDEHLMTQQDQKNPLDQFFDEE